ncbi:MAG: hypothetical protein E2O38_02420 [Proteobacteria bacterium]|nr:hypothetical protein [Pseudomonadota bacterium]TDJ73523.1 MAG: hypothetical protein E2O38_02420 [Pseudomonadota bacterium]
MTEKVYFDTSGFNYFLENLPFADSWLMPRIRVTDCKDRREVCSSDFTVYNIGASPVIAGDRHVAAAICWVGGLLRVAGNAILAP